MLPLLDHSTQVSLEMPVFQTLHLTWSHPLLGSPRGFQRHGHSCLLGCLFMTQPALPSTAPRDGISLRAVHLLFIPVSTAPHMGPECSVNNTEHMSDTGPLTIHQLHSYPAKWVLSAAPWLVFSLNLVGALSFLLLPAAGS